MQICKNRAKTYFPLFALLNLPSCQSMPPFLPSLASSHLHIRPPSTACHVLLSRCDDRHPHLPGRPLPLLQQLGPRGRPPVRHHGPRTPQTRGPDLPRGLHRQRGSRQGGARRRAQGRRCGAFPPFTANSANAVVGPRLRIKMCVTYLLTVTASAHSVRFCKSIICITIRYKI